MDQPIRIPRNLSALMQHIQRLASCGHHFWTADRIPRDKLPGFIAKWQPRFALRADAPARAYRKRTGRASVHLVIPPDFLDHAQTEVGWWMLSTAGKEGLLGPGGLPGPVRDGRTLEGRLACGDYELVQQPKSFKDGAKVKTMTTWTWRITPPRYRAWEALLVERAQQRNYPAIREGLACLMAMPMFAGIRAQVIRLLAETNRMLAKVGGMPVELPRLPVMRMIRLWADQDEL
jgi:hypothetical protein